MIETPGICCNGSACQVAARGEIVTVPLGAAFVCHQCGTPLAPPVQHTPAPVGTRSPLRPLALGCFALLLAGGAVLAGRMLALQTSGGVAQVELPKSAARSKPLTRAPTPVPRASKPEAATMSMAAPSGPAATSGAGVTQAQRPAPGPADVRPAALPRPAAGAGVPVVQTSPPAQAVQAPPPPVLALATAAPHVPRVTPPTSALGAPPASQPAPPAIIDPPFNPVPLAGGAPAYPASLAADGRPGRVVVTCQIMADGRPQSCHAGPAKGGPAFSAAVLAWLDRGQVRYRPLMQHGRPVAGIRSWPISIEEPAALLAQARQQALVAADSPPVDPTRRPPPPAPPAAQIPTRSNIQPVVARLPLAPAASATPADRPFSTHVLQGGQPEYPAIYTESRPGSVTVRCKIETNGAPSDCELVHQSGGSSFGQSVQNWLRFGHVRFAPIIADGHPVSRVQTWTVTFKPPTQ